MTKQDLLYKLIDMLQGIDESDLRITKDFLGNVTIEITREVILKRNFEGNKHVEKNKKEIVRVE